MTSSPLETGRAPAPPASGIGEKLAWDAFSALYFPERRRHDLEAVAAYGAYRGGRDWRKSSSQTTAPPRLTLVPNEPTLSAIEAESSDAAAERLLVAVAAEQVWAQGGFRS
jgi:hypothetical protein